MAGFAADKAIKALPGTLDLATAGGIDLGRAADIATNALTAMGLQVEELTRVNDVFVGTITRTNTNMEMMAESFKYSAPLARAYGYSIEELSGLIGTLGNAGIQGCYDNKTEVLTARGWLPWADVIEDDEFATRNLKTGVLEYQKASRLVRYHHKGKMYLVQNRAIDLCVTPDHRMWVKRRGHSEFEVMTAEEVDGKNVSYEAGGLSWRGRNVNNHVLTGFSQSRGSWMKRISKLFVDTKLWSTFLGWYISEGSCDYRRGNYRIRITQNRGVVRDRMRRVLGRLPWAVHEDKNGFCITNEQLYQEVVGLGKARDKHIPYYAKAWSPQLLRLLLRALIEGDGDKNGAYYTSSKQLADDVTEIALKLGYASTLVLKRKAGSLSNFDKEGRQIRSRYDQWKVNIRQKQLQPRFYPHEYRGKHGKRLDGSKFPCHSKWIDYDGEVFCAEVPNHLLIVRRNGKAIVSGNSMAGTQLAMAMLKANKIAKEFSFTSSDLLDVLDSMREAGYTAGQVIEKFGGRAGRAAGVLFEATDAAKKLQEQLGLVAGEAKDLADTMRDTMWGIRKELTSVIESLKLDMYKQWGKELKSIFESLIGWIRENKAEIVLFTQQTVAGIAAIVQLLKWGADWLDIWWKYISRIIPTLIPLRMIADIFPDPSVTAETAAAFKDLYDVIEQADAASVERYWKDIEATMTQAKKAAMAWGGEAGILQGELGGFLVTTPEAWGLQTALVDPFFTIHKAKPVVTDAEKVASASARISEMMENTAIFSAQFAEDMDEVRRNTEELERIDLEDTLQNISAMGRNIEPFAVTFQADMEALRDDMENTGKWMIDWSRRMANSMSAAFENLFFDAFTGQLKSLADYLTSFMNAISRVISQMLAQQLMTKLFPASVPAMQHGGIVTQPTLALIGESGPEAVIPLDRLRDGGGSDKDRPINVTVNINTPDVGSFKNSAAQIATQMSATLIAARRNM